MSSDKKANEETQRRQFSPEQKIKILRQHLLEKIPISEVCEKHQITPTQFYQWQKTLFENGPAAFARTAGKRARNQAEERLTKLEDQLKRKDEVIAEIMAEYIVFKKSWGKLTVQGVPHGIRDQVVDLVRPRRVAGPTVARLDRTEPPPIQPVAGSLRPGQWAQRPGAARPLAGRLGKTRHHRVRPSASAGRLSAAGLHEAGRRRGGRQSQQRLPGLESGRSAARDLVQTHAQRRRLSAAAPAA